MSKNIVLVFADSMSKKDIATYEKIVRPAILNEENYINLIFVHGRNPVILKKGDAVRKVIFDIKNSIHEAEIISAARLSITKINKEKVPVYLRMGRLGHDEFGCISINSFKMVKFFNPSEVPCIPMKTVAKSM
jgi:hypothetical protein